ncbi:MAG: DUF3618 domain-containing protein [Gemmatimonadaceae bacterium]
MAETTADVRRDIEMTRERMSMTIAQLEEKLNVTQMVRDHPWPAIALALGAGFALSGSRADVKAAAATVAATQGASGRVGSLLDDVVANLIVGVNQAIHSHVDGWVSELKQTIGAPATPRGAGNGPDVPDVPTTQATAPLASGMGAGGSWAPQTPGNTRAD